MHNEDLRNYSFQFTHSDSFAEDRYSRTPLLYLRLPFYCGLSLPFSFPLFLSFTLIFFLSLFKGIHLKLHFINNFQLISFNNSQITRNNQNPLVGIRLHQDRCQGQCHPTCRVKRQEQRRETF